MTEEIDSEVAADNNGEKPKRRVRKVSPKPTTGSRGRSPTPGEGSPPISPTTAAAATDKRPAKRKEKLPTNAPRSMSPSGPTTRSPASRTKPDRAQSPKRTDEGKVDNNDNKKERSPNVRKEKLSPKRSTGEDTGAGGDCKKKTRPQSPKRGTTDDSLLSTNRSHRSATSRGRSPGPNKDGTENNESPRRRKEGPRMSPKGARKDTTPGRAITTKRSGGKGGPSPKGRIKKKGSKNPAGQGETSLELDEALAIESNESGEESESEHTEGGPRYVSPKGNTTHLQLDLSTIDQKGGGGMNVFSLLDENSLLDGCSVEDEGSASGKTKSRNPRLNNPHRDSLLDNLNGKKTRVQKRLSQTGAAPEPLVFKPWAFEDDEKDASRSPVKNNNNDNGSSPKAIKSPIALTKAVKALKYTTNMAGASNFMGKMTTGLFGSNAKHQQMEDEEDDLEGLL